MTIRSSWLPILLLAGCETTLPWSDGTPVTSGAAISVSPTSLSFSARAGGATPATQTLHVSAKGTVYVGYQVSGAAIAGATLGQGAASSGNIVVSPAAPTSSATTWTGTVTVVGCVDASCTRQVAGSPVVVPVTYSVTPPPLQAVPASLAFTVVQGGLAAAAQTLQLAGTGVAWTSSADQPWIKLGSTAGTAPASLAVGIDATGLAPGPYNGTIAIAGASGVDGARVAVQLTVQAPALRTDHDRLTFQAVNGTTVATQALSISVNTGLPEAWTATAGADWIVLDKGSGTTPDTLVVAIDPSRGNRLASGSYSSSVTLTVSSGGDTLTRVIPITLVLTKPTLTVTPASLSAGGSMGRDAPVTATLQVSLDTGENAHLWKANPDQPRIGLDPRIGKVGGTPTAVHVDWDRTGLAGGSHTGTIAITAVVNGDVLTASVPVSLNLDSHLLLADDEGVALATMPGLSALRRTLHVRDNLGLTTAWTASADQAWLSVTQSGTTPGELVVTADPAGLSTDTIHHATVTIASSDPTVERAETIRVGLWVGAEAAASRYVAVKYGELVLDPIRPLAYVHAGGSSITVHNVYTGAVVATVSTASSTLGRMVVASDGSRLYVADASQPAVRCVNLADLSQATPFSLSSSAEALAYTRTNGKRLLLAGNGHVLDASSGADLGARVAGRYFANMIHVSQDGARFAAQNAGISPSSFAVYGLDYTAVGGGELFITAWTSGSGGSNGEDLALNADGSRLYTVNGAPYEFPVFDVSLAGAHPPRLAPLPGVAYPGNIEVARDGRIFAGASASSRPVDTWIFSPSGTLLGSMKLSVSRDVLVGQLKVSGDGLRLAALTEDPFLRFVTVAP